MTPLQVLATWSASVSAGALPRPVVEAVQDHVLDTVGLCLAATPMATSHMARRLAVSWGGAPDASLLGYA